MQSKLIKTTQFVKNMNRNKPQLHWTYPPDNSSLLQAPNQQQTQNIYNFCTQWHQQTQKLSDKMREAARLCKFSKLTFITNEMKLKEVLGLIVVKGYVLIDSFSEFETSYKGFISWLVISTNDEGYLLDCSKYHDWLYSFKNILQDSSILKFCFQIPPLLNDFKRDCGIFMCNLMDLEPILKSIQTHKSQKQQAFSIDFLQKMIYRNNLGDRPMSETLFNLIQQKYDLTIKCLSKLSHFLDCQDEDFNCYEFCNNYELLLKPYQHQVPTFKELDENLKIKTSLIEIELQKERKLDKENQGSSLNEDLLQRYSQRCHLLNKTYEEDQLSQSMLEWREHLAKMQDSHSERILPYFIIMEIIKQKARSIKELEDLFKTYTQFHQPSIQKIQQIAEVILLHHELIEEKQQTDKVLLRKTANPQNKFKQEKPQKNIKKLLKDVGWDNSELWLNRKNDESIKLYKEIISIVELDNSIIEEYEVAMSERLITKNQIGRFVRYAEHLRNGNQSKLRDYYKFNPRLGEKTKDSDQEFRQFYGLEEEPSWITNSPQLHPKDHQIKSLTSLDSTQHLGFSDGRTLGTIQTTNTLPSGLDLHVQKKTNRHIVAKEVVKIAPLPTNIEQIYLKAVDIKKTYTKVQKKKKDKRQSKKDDQEEEFIPTKEDLKRILQM